MEIAQCSICLDNFNSGLTQCINDARGQTSCPECMEQYVKSVMSDSFHGTCPIIYCPLCVTDKAKHRCILPYGSLVSSVLDCSIINRYEDLAKSLLSIQCSNCHKRGSILVPYDGINRSQHLGEIQLSLAIDYTEFMDDVDKFGVGSLTVTEFYDRLMSTYFPAMPTSTDRAAWEIFKKILSLIVNPERRASLHLRFIRFRPRVWSQCCEAQMCFKCKTRDYHEGRSCEQVSESASNELIPCHQCGLQLVKGDGCDHVTCLCGYSFGWSSESRRIEQVATFSARYPEQTALHCARILCTSDESHPLRTIANSWKSWNSEDYKRGLVNWWLETFPQFSVQHCVLTTRALGSGSPSIAAINDDRVLASKVFSHCHHEEFSRRDLETVHSITSLFHSFYPTYESCLETVTAQVSALAGPDDGSPLDQGIGWTPIQTLDFLTPDTMRLAVEPWARDNLEAIRESTRWSRYKEAMQFLCVHGQDRVCLVPTAETSSYPGVCSSSLRHCYRRLSPDRALVVGDVVQLRDSSVTSTVKMIFSDGMLFLLHGDAKKGQAGGNYLRHRVEYICSPVALIPSLAMSSQQTHAFVCLLHTLSQLVQCGSDETGRTLAHFILDRFSCLGVDTCCSYSADSKDDVVMKELMSAIKSGRWAELWDNDLIKQFVGQFSWNKLVVLCAQRVLCS